MRWTWITTLGSRNRRRRGGMQYCPACFREDRHPYYRLRWRFAWHTVCESHSVALRDGCPFCNAPIEPHRLAAGSKSAGCCARCSFSLENVDPAPCDPRTITFQRTADRVLASGSGVALSVEIAPHEWFGLLSFYISTVRRAGHTEAGSPLRRFLATLNVIPPEIPRIDHSLELESLGVDSRRSLVTRVERLMSATPEALESALLDTGLSRVAFCDRSQTLPDVLEPIVRRLPDAAPRRRRKRTRPPGPRTRREVERMMARLERRLERER